MAAATQIVSLVSPKEKIKTTAGLIHDLQEELNDLFPERENLITQLIYALVTREHLLVFGKYGTGKSRLVERLVKSFLGASLFSIELTKFMSESNIIGIPNPKILREQGVIFHERKGTILDAHFAELDELFDANDYLLRVLLGILNERRFQRGVQFEKANLHTALASTNADPDQQVKRAPELGAVMDRFLFQIHVSYLEKDDSRRRMYAHYLEDASPTVKLPYEDLDAFACQTSLIRLADPSLIELHNQIVEKFQEKRRREFSDRRTCQAIKLAQANAILSGRDMVEPADFMAIVWALSKGSNVVAHEEFKAVANPLIEDAVKRMMPNVSLTQLQLLDELEKRILAPVNHSDGTAPSADELVTGRRMLITLETNVKDVKPSDPTVSDRQQTILAKIEKAKYEIQKLIDNEKSV